MSNRKQDQGLIDLIRSLMSRITKLETQQSSVKRNDIRLGDIVVTSDREYDRIRLKNLITGNTSYLGNPQNAEFSFSGELTLALGAFSPPYPQAVSSVANAIVVSQITNLGPVTVRVYFNNGTYSQEVILPDGANVFTTSINVPVGANTMIYVELVDYPEGSEDLTVVVRFGDGVTSDRTDV